jgi:DNA modification methylase
MEYLLLVGLKNSLGPVRGHDERQISLLKKSIDAFGFLFPILVDGQNNVISGQARVLAAQQLAYKEVPAVRVEHLTEAQKQALMIADNRISELASWDKVALAKILRDLRTAEPDFDIEATGFTLDEIDLQIEELNLSTGTDPDPDDQMSAPSAGPTVSQPGDLWLLGENRLLHGDATKQSELERLMNGKRAAMTFTDPPYGVNYANSAKDQMRGTHRPILNDDLGEGFEGFLSVSCTEILSVTDGAIYICMSSSALHLLQGAFVKAGGHWSTFIIWAKQTFTLGRADYQRQYEPILYGWREGAERHWCGARDQGDVWFFDKPVKNDLHPTMKPVQLVMRALRNSSRRGDIVLDPFLGSGSSLIAAERTGRICYGMELDAQYADVSIRRWQDHTGDLAIHAETGKTFDAIARERGVNDAK